MSFSRGSRGKFNDHVISMNDGLVLVISTGSYESEKDSRSVGSYRSLGTEYGNPYSPSPFPVSRSFLSSSSPVIPYNFESGGITSSSPSPSPLSFSGECGGAGKFTPGRHVV